MDGLLMLSMVGATLPAAPSVRKQKSIAFSMLFGRTIVTLAVLPRWKGTLRTIDKLAEIAEIDKSGLVIK